MFLRGKKTIYLDLYEDDKKVCNVGFAQFCGSSDLLKLSVQIKKGGESLTGNYQIVVQSKEESACLGTISLQHGIGTFEKEWRIHGETVKIGNIIIAWEDMQGVCAQGLDMQFIWGGIHCHTPRKVHTTKPVSEKEREKKCQSQQMAEIFSEQQKNVTELIIQENFCKGKWEQLLKEYPNVHPFSDERVFISIEPKDFLILEESCQRLVHNSFLLHGFYNYRHVILGKDKKMGSNSETCFYLGVPGTFFEREKQVAVMFGFEGFESAGAVEIGKFGYYMREVFI